MQQDPKKIVGKNVIYLERSPDHCNLTSEEIIRIIIYVWIRIMRVDFTFFKDYGASAPINHRRFENTEFEYNITRHLEV